MDYLINSPAPSRDWAKLPDDLLYCVLEKLTLQSDYIRFGVVCELWSLSALQQKQTRKESIGQEPPLLLVAVTDNLEEWFLYSVCEGKTYNYRVSIPYRRWCCGSSYGWLAIAENDLVAKVLSITLLNPFSGNTIHLPAIFTDLNPEEKPEFLVHKVILSCDPSLYPDDYVVAAIYGLYRKIAFIRPGSKSWNFCRQDSLVFLDIHFHENLLYVVSLSASLLAVDYNYKDEDEDEDERIEINPSQWLEVADHVYNSQTYLAESSTGNLLLIHRVFYLDNNNTIGFMVYRLQMNHKGKQKWVKVPSLENDDALFLGPNHSICISAVYRFPNCRPNSIYYTDDHCLDFRVFHLEDSNHGDHLILDSSLRFMAPIARISPVLSGDDTYKF